MIENQPFHFPCGNSGHGTGTVTFFQSCRADVISELFTTLFPGVGWHHGAVTLVAEYKAFKRRWGLFPGLTGALHSVGFHYGMDPVPHLLGNDGFMFTGKNSTLVDHTPQIDRVFEQLVEGSLIERNTAPEMATLGGPGF